MARFSDKKNLFCQHIANALPALELRAGKVASHSDALALKYADLAVKFATQWTKDTTEASRRECAKNVALMQENAGEGTHSTLNQGLLAYAQGLKLFLACEYKPAMKFINMATRLVE